MEELQYMLQVVLFLTQITITVGLDRGLLFGGVLVN